ncbi:MAG: beta-hexosaminidase [Flavobacteriales bacterium]|nr:beta-hexosaminidase [Flavobacteriales bacterium]|tara:strand:+ start:4103 stop:6109 length:2007 start_codon:yes stop_codon:yes gene_type:complete
MKFLVVVFCLFFSSLSSQHLLPQPSTYNKNVGKFVVSPQTYVYLKHSSEDLKKYTERFIRRLQNRSGITLESLVTQDTSHTHEIIISYTKNIDQLELHIDESYTIQVTPNKISIESPTNIGVYRAMETLLQLVKTNEKGAYIGACTITDQPRFPWRGLLIDVCRHWIPLEIILQNIDAMAAVKMNVIHLHLTEDQGFRIESKKFPLLHQLGNDGNYYTQDDIKKIIQYAKERGIRVIPEIDIPGHSTSWLVGYPRLASIERDYEVATRFGLFKGSINPINDYSYNFLDTLLTEICALFPDRYFHIGGDENNGLDWEANRKIQKFKIKNELLSNQELQAYFNRKILDILSRNKKIMVGWDEIFDAELPNTIAIQSWRGKKSLYKTAESGFESILSNGYYLDKVQPLSHYYKNDPVPVNAVISPKAQKMILGGEATMWTELTDHTNINSRIWPSTLALAERLWSTPSNCNTKYFYEKVPYISNQLQEFGLNHISFQATKLKQMSHHFTISEWKPFIEILEPVKGYKRHGYMKNNTTNYNTTASFNRIVDACYVESFQARQFNEYVKVNCKDGFCKSKDKIMIWLSAWVEATGHFHKISKESPQLFELHFYAAHVQELCELTWQKLNSPGEFSNINLERSHQLIDLIENFNTDVYFAPIEGLKLILNKNEQ